jgi:hypothetical protein
MDSHPPKDHALVCTWSKPGRSLPSQNTAVMDRRAQTRLVSIDYSRFLRRNQ